MKVYSDEDGGTRLVGTADGPEDAGLVYKVPLFTAASVIVERFTIGTVTRLQEVAEIPRLSAP